MRVAVLCERSGVVRDAFLRYGHDAISCDLEPTDSPGRHYQGDALRLLGWGPWDLVVAFPPCTYLCRAGARWWSEADAEHRRRAELFALSIWTWRGVKRVCLENPEGRLRAAMGAPSQVVQPWQFGHVEQKKTLLWLRRLPVLRPTRVVAELERERFVDLVPPGPERQAIRSRFWEGIADAMALQWGDLDSKASQPTSHNL